MKSLDTLGPVEARLLLAPARQWHRDLVGSLRSLRVLAFAIPVTAFLAIFVTPRTGAWLAFNAEGCGIAYAVAVVLYADLQVRRLRRLRPALSVTSSLGAVGLLLRASYSLRQLHQLGPTVPDPWEAAVYENLARLLSRIERGHYGLLDDEEHRLLRSLIQCDHRETAHAALEAVTRLGEPEGVACLEQIAELTTLYPGLRQRAEESLKQLAERTQREAAGANLLRASHPSHDEVLLRSPQPSQLPADQLLRSTAAEE